MRVLALGGTGAIGSHLCRLLAGRGCTVVCTTRRGGKASCGVDYVVGDAKDPVFLGGLLEEHWDAIVDFMVWSTAEFRERYRGFLASTGQYVFTSSYRVYADVPVIREDSPRLLDVVDDDEYLATDEYALCKARCEDILFGSGSSNWTIVRPAVTYDGANGRFQLGVFELGDWIWRAEKGVPVPMPREILRKQATMTSGADVAEMISRLVGNPDARGEAFTASGSDHMAWGDVADVYAAVLPLRVVECSLPAFERQRGSVYQVRYDRMLNRVVDNSKVLAATGIDGKNLTPMREGLVRELGAFLETGRKPECSFGFQGKMDCLCGGFASLVPVVRDGGLLAAGKYAVRRAMAGIAK